MARPSDRDGRGGGPTHLFEAGVGGAGGHFGPGVSASIVDGRDDSLSVTLASTRRPGGSGGGEDNTPDLIYQGDIDFIMFYIREADPSPSTEAVEPTLKFRLVVVPQEFGSLVGLRASLWAEDGKRLSEGAEAYSTGSPFTASLNQPSGPFVPHDTYLELTFRLSYRELAHIERCRELNKKHDVVLTIKSRATSLRASYITTYTDYYRYQVPNVIPRQTEDLIVVHPASRQGGPTGPSIVSPDPNQGLLTLYTEDVGQCPVTIPSSDWSHEFAPAFGLGRFLVLEVPQLPVGAEGSGELADRVREASGAIERMRVDLQKGEWTQCAEDARAVVELLNKGDLIRPLLETNGIRPETAQSLLDGLQGVLAYSHAFHHRVDQAGQKPVPSVNAESEDAYLAFATSAALLNLVGKKLQKSSK